MIPFMRYRIWYLIISLVILIPGLFMLARFGFKPAIDFTGGALIEFQASGENKPTADEVRQTLADKGFAIGSVQTTSQNTYIARLAPVDESQHASLTAVLTEKFGTITEARFETVGPTLGRELLVKTFIAAAIAITAILAYIAWSFKNIRYGVSAIIALLHDVLVVVSVFAILGVTLGVEVDALFVTAILTTMSFSVHDTIVVFDRIRESEKRNAGMPFEQRVNVALTETMSRSLNNSLTIIFMLLALFLMGGETIKWFVLALLIGTISGTYSSPFVATPILYIWSTWRRKAK